MDCARWMLCSLVAACAIMRAAAAQAPAWQPYRDATPASVVATAGGLEPLPAVVPAQATYDPTLFCPPAAVCPQPVMAAPMYGVPCYVDAAAATPTDPASWSCLVESSATPIGVPLDAPGPRPQTSRLARLFVCGSPNCTTNPRWAR